jgi:hypothetical protein
VLAERLVEEPCLLGQHAVADIHAHPLVAEDAEPAAARLGGRVLAGHDHPGYACLDDRVGARGSAAVVRARIDVLFIVV